MAASMRMIGIARARLDRLLRKRQETRVDGRISEGRK